jgi:hypothetical protein
VAAVGALPDPQLWREAWAENAALARLVLVRATTSCFPQFGHISRGRRRDINERLQRRSGSVLEFERSGRQAQPPSERTDIMKTSRILAAAALAIASLGASTAASAQDYGRAAQNQSDRQDQRYQNDRRDHRDRNYSNRRGHRGNNGDSWHNRRGFNHCRMEWRYHREVRVCR